VLVTVTVVTPPLRPLSAMVEVVAPLVTVAVATVGSEDTAVTPETAPPSALAVAVTDVEAPLFKFTVLAESVSDGERN
jgi:hypothetical protein